MESRTVEWPVPPPVPGSGTPQAGGLRERKKRLMRQQLSDTATRMFMERGFDGVRVTEIAEACGVSEKTVFNYFPAKEALILDRLEATTAALKSGLADPGVPPVRAVLRILDGELGAMTSWLAAQDDPARASAAIRRFGTLIWETPALRAYQSDMMDQSTAMVAAILAGHAGLSPDEPEPQIAATALLGLWRIQYRALPKYLDGTRTPAEVRQVVAGDVRRAARLISIGLDSLPARLDDGRPGLVSRACTAGRRDRAHGDGRVPSEAGGCRLVPATVVSGPTGTEVTVVTFGPERPGRYCANAMRPPMRVARIRTAAGSPVTRRQGRSSTAMSATSPRAIRRGAPPGSSGVPR